MYLFIYFHMSYVKNAAKLQKMFYIYNNFSEKMFYTRNIFHQKVFSTQNTFL